MVTACYEWSNWCFCVFTEIIFQCNAVKKKKYIDGSYFYLTGSCRKWVLQTDYPDRSSVLFCPRESEFKEIAAQTYRLLCKVLVQADNLWSDSARVRFGCVLKSHQSVDMMPSASSFTRSSCIPVPESPFSSKQATMEIPIQPVQAKASC